MVAMTSDGLDRFLSRLSRVKQTGDGEWIASCPAAGHGQGRGDIHPSLSINRGNGSGALLHCHAGCRNEDILAAVGIRWPDLLPPKETTRCKPSSTIVATYDYTDDAGMLLYQAVRYEPKDFRQRRPDLDHPGAWIWNLKEIPRVLYRLPDVKKAIAARETVFIVEGEKDVDNLRCLGVTATCNVGGAGKWKPEYSDVLRGAAVIVIPDADEPGRKHASQVFDALRGIAEKVKILPLPGDGKDVSDWIAAGGTREKFEELVATVTSPTPEKPPLFDDVGRTLRIGGIPAPIWLVKGLIERGLIQLFGPSGAGKSFIAMLLAFCLVTGRCFFRKKVEVGPVVYVCGEGRAGAYRRFAALEKYYGIAIPEGSLFLSRRAVNLDATSIDELCDEIKAATKAGGRPPVALFIDTLARTIVGDENLQKDMSEFVNAVEAIAAEIGCAAIIIHHSGHSPEAQNRGRGSSVFIGACDSIIKCADRMLTWNKAKDGEIPEPVPFALKKILLGKDEDGEEISSAVIVEAGEGTASQTLYSSLKLTPGERLAVQTLVETSAKGELRDGRWWIGVAEWRAEYAKRYWQENPKTKEKAHIRDRRSLVSKGLASVENDCYAVIRPEDEARVQDLVTIGPMIEKAKKVETFGDIESGSETS